MYPVKDWMTRYVVSIKPDTPVTEAAERMRAYGIRRLPVVENGKLVGLVTQGDLQEAGPSDATSLSIHEVNYLVSQLTVHDAMTRDVVTVAPNADMIDAAELMLNHKISGLPVVDAGRLVGVLSEADIFRMLVQTRERIPI